MVCIFVYTQASRQAVHRCYVTDNKLARLPEFSVTGGSTLSYMPKNAVPSKPMPKPGFFATPKSQTKLAEPKPAEPGIPPNVVMSKCCPYVRILSLGTKRCSCPPAHFAPR